MFNIGLDIGGTKTEIQVFDSSGLGIYKRREATCKTSYDEFTQHIVAMIHSAESTLDHPCNLGICLPGSIDPSTGLIKNSNILVINQHPFQHDLEEIFQRPVSISNDANCFTLSEAVDGAGQDAHSVFGVILGTGCGGGYVVNHQLQQGKNGNCGEWGHIPLPHYRESVDGPSVSCYCGQLNCIESFISGTGINRQLTYHYGYPVDSVTFFNQLLQNQNKLASQCFERFQDQLARCFAMLINLLDPDVIVIGGGLSNVPQLFDGINQRIGQYTFGHYHNTPIRTAVHGDSSGIRGAAWLGRQHNDQ
ncbi:ROK family protein [Celerinatantimonas yamalensis]|uniref:ROK family protein n=1 Tax=Celerinatantimonas yamalensis TaxID=559956 RepID=A0ABW9G6M5_9GAMM